MKMIERSSYPGWADHPVYHCKTYAGMRLVEQWMSENDVESFLLSSGSAGYKFQVKSNHEWFALRWE